MVRKFPYSKDNYGVMLFIKVAPHSKTNQFKDIFFDSIGNNWIKLCITDIAVDNKANYGVIKFLSNYFSIASSLINIKSGEKTKFKKIFINNAIKTDFIIKTLNQLAKKYNVKKDK